MADFVLRVVLLLVALRFEGGASNVDASCGNRTQTRFDWLLGHGFQSIDK
jgi:hypothetical protein